MKRCGVFLCFLYLIGVSRGDGNFFTYEDYDLDSDYYDERSNLSKLHALFLGRTPYSSSEISGYVDLEGRYGKTTSKPVEAKVRVEFTSKLPALTLSASSVESTESRTLQTAQYSMNIPSDSTRKTEDQVEDLPSSYQSSTNISSTPRRKTEDQENSLPSYHYLDRDREVMIFLKKHHGVQTINESVLHTTTGASWLAVLFCYLYNVTYI